MSVSQPPESGLPALSSVENDLLARAREQLHGAGVPSAARARLLAHALGEARRGGSVVSKPTPLVRVRSRGAAQALGVALTMAAALVLFARTRGASMARGGAGAEQQELAGAEQNDADASRRIGARLFQSELFHAPAGDYRGAMPSAAASLFPEPPFAPQSGAWQARRWNDLAAPPSEPAAYEYVGDALCIRLTAGERVVAGWPWLAASDGGERAQLAAPAPVALQASVHYRLVFKAWASEPLPEQLLVAVGHARVPFSGAGGARVEVSAEPRAYVVDFVPRYADPSVGVAFLVNGAAPGRVCISDMTLSPAVAN